MPLRLTWTKQADEALLEMRGAGLPWHALAQQLGVGRNAAIERSRRLGLVPITRIPPAPAAQTERIDRPALPAGHPASWQAITAGTCLEGEAYPFPVYA